MIVLQFLLIILSALLCLIILLLVCQTHIAVQGNLRSQANTLSATVTFLGRILGVTVTTDLKMMTVRLVLISWGFRIYHGKLGSAAKSTTKPKPKPKPKPKTSKEEQPKLSFKEWLDLGKVLIRKVVKFVHFDKLRAYLTIGLGDPFKTGMLMGTFYALKGSTGIWEDCLIEPNFMRKMIEGEVELAASLRLARLIPLGLFIFSKLKRRK